MAKGTAAKKSIASGVRYIKCNCASPYQDRKYGAGVRVHNPTASGSRCTVCGSEKT